eukprot:3613741-Rhodomonas_salina.2
MRQQASAGGVNGSTPLPIKCKIARFRAYHDAASSFLMSLIRLAASAARSGSPRRFPSSAFSPACGEREQRRERARALS